MLSKLSDHYRSVLVERVPRPINDGLEMPVVELALGLHTAQSDLLRAERDLEQAKDKARNAYTGQYSTEDYYAAKQEDYNRAVEAYTEALCRVLGVPGLPAPTTDTPFQQAMNQRVEAYFAPFNKAEKSVIDNHNLVFVGDLIEIIDSDKVTGRFLTMENTNRLLAIPPRWGLEDWQRPWSRETEAISKGEKA